MAQKSENSRKIAAKISEGMQGNGIFRNSYKIDAVRVRVFCGLNLFTYSKKHAYTLRKVAKI